MTPQPKEVIEKFVEYFNRHDADALAELSQTTRTAHTV